MEPEHLSGGQFGWGTVAMLAVLFIPIMLFFTIVAVAKWLEKYYAENP